MFIMNFKIYLTLEHPFKNNYVYFSNVDFQMSYKYVSPIHVIDFFKNIFFIENKVHIIFHKIYPHI